MGAGSRCPLSVLEKHIKPSDIVLFKRTEDEHRADLNFHHLRYFWAVAKDGNLTRTAARLRVAQSALSSQIQQLEAQLGEALFAREGRRLVLTEAGTITLAYAEEIFSTGSELLSTLEHGRRGTRAARRRGGDAVAQLPGVFVKPLLQQPDMRPAASSPGCLAEPARCGSRATPSTWCSPTDRPRASPTVGSAAGASPGSRSASSGRGGPRPSASPRTSPTRRCSCRAATATSAPSFDALCEQSGVRVRVLAEVDDMATMRLLARDTRALALVPSVVVRDELREGVLYEYCAALHTLPGSSRPSTPSPRGRLE